MKKLSVFAIALALVIGLSGQVSAAVIAGWDFQTTTTGGTATAASPATPKVYVANFGAGTMYLDGSNGSSNWFVPGTGSTNTELNAFAGTIVNAGPGFSTTTTGAASLALVNQTANSKQAVIRFSMLGLSNLEISYASQRTSSGFTSQTWEWSTDGASYNSIGSKIAGTNPGEIRDTFNNTGVLSFTNISGLDNAANAYIRITFAGATSGTGNNRLDNIQLSAVPEPSTLSLLGLAITGAPFLRRRR